MKYFTKKTLLFFVALLLLCTESSMGQSADEIRSSPELYLWGEGSSTTIKRADDYALEALITQISVDVRTDFENSLIEESNSMGASEVQERSSLLINTYSSATLNNAERLVISNEPSAKVMRYILRSEIDNIFESRRRTISEFVELGQRGINEYKIDNALKYYYWALLLTKSLRKPNQMEITDNEGKVQRALTWLPDQINRILDNVRTYRGADIDGNAYTISITYNNKPVATMDYTYFDGMNWSNIYSAKDGVGIVELRETSLSDNLQIRCEYMFDNEIRQQREVESVSEAIDPIPFSKATVTVIDNNSQSKNQTKEAQAATTSDNSRATSMLEQVMLAKGAEITSYNVPSTEHNQLTTLEDVDEYRSVISKVAASIQSQSISTVRSLFTEGGYEMFQKLIGYGNTRLLDNAESAKFIGYGDRVVCRGLPVSFSFTRNVRTFTENIAFTFNCDKKIESLSFTLTQETIASLLEHTEWDEVSRMIIINFIEDYQTAYALKRWDYLNTIFDDDALIIIGKDVRRTTMTDSGMNFGNNRYVQLTQLSKTQYLKNLSGVFSSNEYINLKFANCSVSRFNDALGEVYGIQLKQDYYSSNYADSGYLFLMVDLNNPTLPVIHVRTWQEKPDENFGIISNINF
ncbi:MAG: hypothetical protein R3Y49_02540 [Rikenellaceae bacterium]